MPLDADAVRLARGPNLATVVTLMPDGQPQALLTWVDTDGEHVLVNTEPQRQRAKNVSRDPRITVLIHSADDPWDWAEVRGRVVHDHGRAGPRPHRPAVPQVPGPGLRQSDRPAGPGDPDGRRRQGEHPEVHPALTLSLAS